LGSLTVGQRGNDEDGRQQVPAVRRTHWAEKHHVAFGVFGFGIDALEAVEGPRLFSGHVQ